MGKTTKGSQPTTARRLLEVRPNPSMVIAPAPGPGPAPAPPQPVIFDGIGEHVPDLTFIVEHRNPPDSFIDGANTYHTNCGLRPQTIRSIEHLVNILSTPPTAHIGRMRIVTHAVPNNMAVAMFEGSNVFHAMKEYLRGFGRDDETGVFAILGVDNLRHFANWNMVGIAAHIRASTPTPPNPLTPFGFGTAGTPAGHVGEFIRYGADFFMVSTNRVKKDNANIPAAEKNILLDAISALMDQRARRIVGATFGTHVASQAEVDQLRAFVLAMTLPNFNSGAPTFNLIMPHGAGAINPFPLLARAAAAIRNNFRDHLNVVKQRFNSTSTIDIRGCRAGEDPDYLQAVREFFGVADPAVAGDPFGLNPNLPRVTAPRWFQFFGSSSYSNPANNAAIRALLTAGANAAETRAGFDEWAARAHVDPLHKTFWIDLVADADGIVVRFSLLEWRASIPRLPLQTPGLTAFVAMNFRDAIARIQEFFNVPAGSTPAGAALNTLNDFVTNHLRGYAPNLLAQVSPATTEARRRELYQALSLINQELHQAFVPATPPNPPTANDVTTLQTELIRFIETTPLSTVRAFMTAIRQRINDANDPGISYYMLHAGLPVFIFGRQEQMLAGHAVSVSHNRLVVLDQHADSAYRQWPPLLWVEPLPAANTIGALHPGDANARRFAMMVERSQVGPTTVIACPHPDYMNEIRSEP